MSKPVFEDLFTFYGRRNRKSFLLFHIVWFATYIMGQAVLGVFIIGMSLLIGTMNLTDNVVDIVRLDTIHSVVFLALSVFWFFCAALVVAQRFRDIGWSGWFVLLFIIPDLFFLPVGRTESLYLYLLPIAILLGWITLLCVPGNRGENKYGPDPLC